MKSKNKYYLKSGLLYFWLEPSWKSKVKDKHKREVDKDFVLQRLRKFDIDSSIDYAPNGAPILNKKIKIDDAFYSNISISHSGGWFAFYFSKSREGVDIQLLKENIKDAPYFFMKDSEIEKFNSINDFHLIWGAKEAFYKKLLGNIKNTKEDLEVLNIDYQNQRIELLYKNAVNFLSFRILEDRFLVWTNL